MPRSFAPTGPIHSRPTPAGWGLGPALALTIALLPLLPALAADLPAGFVRLRDVDPSIRQDMRYAGSMNFLGRPAAGYEAPECILTEQAAQALSEVQQAATQRGVTLVVFDCYRPVRAVEDFVRWVKEGGPPEPRWHPKIKRSQLIAKGYIGAKSNHSRGSTVDLALAPLQGPAATDDACGSQGTNTLEFGGGFDCFDEKSRTAAPGISTAAAINRKQLVAWMKEGGFRNYAGEWWHFTLRDEPFEKRFDFPVDSK